MTDAEIEKMVAQLEASLGTKHYFLKADWQTVDTEVTREVWIEAERNAGFYPKFGDGEATGAFSAHGVKGYINYEKETP